METWHMVNSEISKLNHPHVVKDLSKLSNISNIIMTTQIRKLFCRFITHVGIASQPRITPGTACKL